MAAETNGVSKLAETKAEKFERLRDTRLPKILHAIGLLENLATAAYESTQEQRADVVRELCDKIATLSVAFGATVRMNIHGPDVVQSEPHDPVRDYTSEPTAYEQVQRSQPDPRMGIPTESVAAEPVRRSAGVPTNTSMQGYAESGRLEIDGVGQAESVHLIKTGAYIGGAIEAIDDGEPEKAKELLLRVMIS